MSVRVRVEIRVRVRVWDRAPARVRVRVRVRGGLRPMPLDGTEAVGRQPEEALHEGRIVQGDLEARRRRRRK